MPRQSISIPKPNDERLKAQIEKEEYSSKSELVNDLKSDGQVKYGIDLFERI